MARHATSLLAVDLDNDTDESFSEFLRSLWMHPGNASAYAYLGLLAPGLGLLPPMTTPSTPQKPQMGDGESGE